MTRQRRQTATRMTVLHGMAEILQTLDPTHSDELDFSSMESTAESWIIENASDGGCGAIIPAAKSDWVRVGALIGVKSEVAQHWGIGLIRRVTRDEHQQRRVGVQLLAKIAIQIFQHAHLPLALRSGGPLGRVQVLDRDVAGLKRGGGHGSPEVPTVQL